MARTLSVSFANMPMLQGASALVFVRLSGHETLGDLFTYTIELKTPDDANFATGPSANLDLRSILGQECSVTVDLDGMGTREINGIITHARIKQAEGRHIVYELIVRPWLWLATRTSDFKIFQEKNVVEILDDVLSDYAFLVEKRLNADYPKRDYQVQYGETDYQFMQRLMQEWGIYWFFVHADGKHRLILCDNPGAHVPFDCPAYQTLRYHPADNRLDEEYIDTFDAAESLTSGAWTSNDFDFTKPFADLTSINSQPRDTDYADAEVYEWPGDYEKPQEGEALARIRMEEQRMTGTRSHGQGNVRAIVPGYVFTLTEHPHDAANREYLVLSTSLELEDISEESGYQEYRQQVRFEVQPAPEPFRLMRTLSKPRTRGPQTAIITGPSGQEIWTDKYGRVKAQFHWDRIGGQDEKSSCWIRVSQPWAGSQFGAMYLPRIGQEVVVDFLNGDPDLPLITGRVYNAANMPPWALPENATQSGVLTRSSKEGTKENANALRFEDKKGEEEVWLHAEKDQRIEVENDESHWVGHDREKNVDHDETVTIGHDRTETVVNNEMETIGVNRVKVVGVHETDAIGVDWNITVGALKMEAVGGACIQTVGKYKNCSVAENFDTTVGEDLSTTVAKNTTFSTGEEHSASVGKNQSISVGEDRSVSAGKNIAESAGENFDTSAGENHTGTAGKEMKFDAGELFQITCGESSLIMDKKGNITLKGKDITIEASGEMGIKADKNITLKGQKILEN